MTSYRSLPKMLGLLLLAIALTSMCWWCTTLPQVRAQVVGRAVVAFFGAGVLLIGWQLFRRGPVVVLDALSITDHRSTDGPVFWDQIRSVWVGSVRSAKFLCIELKDPELFVSRWPAHRRALAKANQALGFPPITISFSGLNPGLEDVTSYIHATHPAKFVDNSVGRPQSAID